jgi:3-oxoacyl-[acyl-carrier protein] reductase
MKTVIVTGTSRGLGKEIASELLAHSYRVIGISRSNQSSIIHENFIPLAYDLANPAGIRDFYMNEIRPLGGICGLVNNAALAYDDLITNASVERIREMFEVNVYSPMLLTKFFIRDLLTSDAKGSIVHISSVSTRTGYKGLSMYASSKAALEGFSQNLSREWGGRGIRSNTIIAGFMRTDMSSSLDEATVNRIASRASMKKLTEPTSVANMARFLLSDEASSITGSDFEVHAGAL